MPGSLSDLLRAALSSTANQLVPLAEELALARNYTEIAQLRYGDGLRVSEHVSSEALSALVPLFILQPLLENAVQHGIADVVLAQQGVKLIVQGHIVRKSRVGQGGRLEKRIDPGRGGGDR